MAESLSGIAAVAAARGQWDQAAWLNILLENLLDGMGAVLSPQAVDIYQQTSKMIDEHVKKIHCSYKSKILLPFHFTP